MKYTIKIVDNGYLIRYADINSEELVEKVIVFEDVDSEVQAFARLLRTLDDLIGPSTSRYDKERIYVEVKPGDKNEDYPNNQEMLSEL